MIPTHGKVECNVCFQGPGKVQYPHDLWKMVNDPGSWGSNSPNILVLGFSKGATQANLYQSSNFEDVAFGGPSRKRLTTILTSVGILKVGENISSYISDPNSRISFGSLVRCSLARLDEKLLKEEKIKKYLSSGSLIQKSFNEVPSILNACAQKYLTNFPATLKLVVLLGINKTYVKKCKDLIWSLHKESYENVGEIHYSAAGVVWIHLPHPSPANGSLHNWLEQNSEMVRKILTNAGVTIS
ncbi:MAG: hypothetical protein ACI9LX_000999 [Paraglaciecola sp.]|jgi:hypothetical protein